MLLSFLKLLGFFWPFFKNVVFKDRSVAEVLKANRHITWLFVILMACFVTLFATIGALSDTKRLLAVTHREMRELTDSLSEKESHLKTLQQQLNNGETCMLVPYDKRHLLELLGD